MNTHDAALQTAVHHVSAGEELSKAQMTAAMEAVLSGDASQALIGALAMGLRMRGETVDEIAAAAQVMRAHCARVGAALPLLDTCGTGGDGSGSFNVSTASAVVAAACGVRVAKHGNRAVSSRCGSADVLEALDVVIDLPPAAVRESVDEVGIGFLFAPAHHGAMRHAAAARRALGLRTFFNLLGPLTNPAGASHQLVGVYDPGRTAMLAQVLGRLGAVCGWVVHGTGGLDEISPLGPTRVAVWSDGELKEQTIGPEDFGMEVGGEDCLAGGDAGHNAAIIRKIVAAEPIPQRAAVVINSAAALLVAGVQPDPLRARQRVEEALDRGEAKELLRRWVEFTQDRKRG